MYTDFMGSCCAVAEIYDLNGHLGDSKAAMLDLCEHQSNKPFSTEKEFSSLYIFSGVERFLKKPEKPRRGAPPWEVQDWEVMCRQKYASKFAKFIRENKLGRLVSLPAAPNTLNHPKHMVKVWLWAPDKKALLKWYQANKG